MQFSTVAILGATGAVGREMMARLEERDFPMDHLRLLASERSVGTTLPFRGTELPVELACEAAFQGCDLVLGAVGSGLAKKLAPAIRAAGAIFVDNSSAFRQDPNVPLVVPELNGEDVKNQQGIIANPNCSTIIALTAVSALHKLRPIRKIVASTYQAVSGAGAAGMAELEQQVEGLVNGVQPQPKAFAYPIAYNLIPQIGDAEYEGYTSEEMKMQNEGRRLLHQPELLVSCTCVRVPVLRSHSISLAVEFEDAISVEEARKAISEAPGCVLVDDLSKKSYPMPLDTTGQDLVYVGRIRKDLCNPKGLCLWCCGDQIRKGAATNAVQIAELLLKL